MNYRVIRIEKDLSPENNGFGSMDSSVGEDFLTGMPPGAEDFDLNPTTDSPMITPEIAPYVIKPSVRVGQNMVYPDALKGHELSVASESFDIQIEAGKLALAAAERKEAELGLETAAPIYNKAKEHLIRAIGLEDVSKPPDISLWLQAGTVLSKLVYTSLAEKPYESANSANIDRKYQWKKAAVNTFKTISTTALEEDTGSSELAKTALVAAEGLSSLNEAGEAKEVLEKASEIFREKESDPTDARVNMVEDLAELPADKIRSEKLHRAAKSVIMELATDSHEIVRLAA